MANSERIYLIQGNDTDMSVCLRKGGDTPLPYDLTGASRIGLALTGHGLSFFARDIVVSGEDNNIISGLLAGDLLVGEYGLEVSFTLDGKAKRFRVPQIFEVVTYLSEDQDGTAEGEGDGISITVTVQPEVIEIAGPTGPQGHDGKSAYEVWLDEGHTGDEDDFFRWLAAQTPNPDWAQNDASEPDYVENRTHYDIPAVSLPDAFITFRWTEDDYSDLMFYLNDETPMPRMSENVWGVQLGQWLLSCYINGNVLEVDLDGDPILTVANFRPGRTPQPILVGDIEVPELVQQLDGKYLGLKTVNGQSVKGSGDIALNGGNLEYTGNDGEYISGGDSINGSLLLLDEAVDETNGRLDNLKGSQVVYDGEDGDSVIVHGETVDQCLKGLDDQAAYIIENYQYKIPDLDTIRAGAALGATAYQKPSTGIPKSALASAVKTSLEKADTALQPSALDGYATEGYVDQEVYEQVSGVVKYTEQTLTDSQKTQARTNIAAASESEVSQLRSEVEGMVKSSSEADLDISDENGEVLARFAGGDFKTKNFDSAKAAKRMDVPLEADVIDAGELDIADGSGNVVLRLEDGHIKTKKFDSSRITVDTVGRNTAWSWWTYPLAIMTQYGYRKKLIWGFCDNEKGVGVCERDEFDFGIRRVVFAVTGQADDHNAPAVIELADGRIVAIYTKGHNATTSVFYRITSVAGDCSTFGEEMSVSIGGNTAYAQVVYVNGKYYVFTRTDSNNWKVIYTSDFETWSAPISFIEAGMQYYIKVLNVAGSDSLLRVAMYSNPSIPYETNIRVGYINVATGNIYDGDGTTVVGTLGTALSFDAFSIVIPCPPQATFGRNRLFDVAITPANRVVIAYASYTSNSDDDSEYFIYDSLTDSSVKICDGGEAFYDGKYQGGAVFIDPDNIVLSRNADGQDYVELWSKENGSWAVKKLFRREKTGSYPIRNIRPLVDTDNMFLLWLRGYYNPEDYHDTDLDSIIVELSNIM